MTTCSTKPEKVPVDTLDFGTQVSNLAKAMGMSQECQKTSEITSLNANAAASAAAGAFGASAEAKMETSMGYETQNNMQKGCGQAYGSMQKVYQQQQVMSCNITTNNSSTDVSSSNSNSIIFKTSPLSDLEQKYKAQIILEMSKDNLTALALTKPNITQKELDFLQNLAATRQKNLQAVLDSYSRDINISGSTISQKIDSQIKMSVKLDATARQELAATQSSIADLVTKQHLQTSLGAGAQDAQISSMVSSTQTTNNVFDSETVNQTIQETKAKSINSNTIEITAPNSVNISNTTFDQNIVSSIVVDALFGAAVSQGVVTAQAALNKAAADVASDTKSAGAEALIAAMGKANADAIALGTSASADSGILAMIIIIVMILGGGGMFLAKGGNMVSSMLTTKIVPVLIVGGIIGIIVFANTKNTVAMILAILLTLALSGYEGWSLLKK